MVQELLYKDAKGQTLPCPISMDRYLTPNVQGIYKYITHNWDAVGIIWGRSGVGKSTFGKILALSLDATFTEKDIFFTEKQFYEWVDQAAPGKVGLFDEADALSLGNNRLMDMIKRKFKRIRKKRLIILLCTPTIRDMNWYFVERCLFGFRLKSFGPDKRGFFDLYSNEERKPTLINLYETMKEKGSENRALKIVKPDIRNGYYANPPNFVPDYPTSWPINEEAYEDKKDSATEDITNPEATAKQKLISYRRECIKRFYEWAAEKNGVKPLQKEVGLVFGAVQSVVSDDLKAVGLRE